MKYFFIFLFFIVFQFDSFSQENIIKNKILIQLKCKENELFTYQTRSLPEENQKSIALLVKYNGEVSNDGFNCDLYLIVFNTTSGEIISKYFVENQFGSDAFRLNSVSLDMANYKIGDSIRAFGVRDSYEGSSSVFPMSSENISLYYFKDNKIIKVLENIETSNFNGDTDRFCKYTFTESSSKLIISKEKNNNFYNIIVKTTSNTRKSSTENKNGDCNEIIIKLKPRTKILIYKNGVYLVKK